MSTNLELQEFLFSNRGNRAILLEKRYEESKGLQKKILVIRNHSFELISSVIIPYLSFSEINAEFIFSDYDDSLTLKDLELNVDLVILWLDLSRYSPEDRATHIKERIQFLVRNAKSPALIATVLGEINIENMGVPHADFAELADELQEKFLDKRLEKLTGTQLSIEAQTRIALELGFQYIPAVFGEKIKTLILDLDNTLYKGVLGEDGVHGLEITSEHRLLQEYLVELSRAGMVVCIATKNDPEDVQQLFDERKDFPLKLTDILLLQAGWMPKSEIIAKINLATNTDPSSYLFVDDNLGEVFEIESAEPRLRSIHAKEDAAETLFRIKHHPGVKKLSNQTNEDLLRNTDLVANVQRQNMQRELTKEHYLRSLNLKIKIAVNDRSQINRISELFNKTNQFIFSYKRFTVPQTELLMEDPNFKVVTVSMSDKLSESGIIACGAIALNSSEAELLEIVVSCRALGRGLDEIIVMELLKALVNGGHIKSLSIPIVSGARNSPALTFHNQYLRKISIQEIEAFTAPQGLIDVKFEK